MVPCLPPAWSVRDGSERPTSLTLVSTPSAAPIWGSRCAPQIRHCLPFTRTAHTQVLLILSLEYLMGLGRLWSRSARLLTRDPCGAGRAPGCSAVCGPTSGPPCLNQLRNVLHDTHF